MVRHALLFLIAIETCLYSRLFADDTPTLDVQLKTVTVFIDAHCVECHNREEAKAGFNLTEFRTDFRSDKAWNTTRWEKIVKRLRSRQMPPVGTDRPTEAEYKKSLIAFEAILDAESNRRPWPGRSESVRRLNRTEYRNAIRDLLAVDVEVDDLLPPDQLSHGFDNVTVGELSPVLLNRYILAAEKISRLAVGRLQRTSGGITVRIPADRSQESHVEGLPFGTRGGALVEYQFPATGEYEVQLRLTRDRDENIEGLNGVHDIDILVDRALIHRFTVEPPKGKQGYNKDDTLVDANLKKRFKVTAGIHKLGVTFPRKFSSLSEIRRQPFDTNFNRHRHPRRAPALFEVSVVGPFALDWPAVEQPSVASLIGPKSVRDVAGFQKRTATLTTPSQRKLFTAWPTGKDDTLKCAQQILQRFVRLAYRRPITPADLSIPLRFFNERCDQDGFEAGIEAAVAAVLVNPHFLFRAEKAPENAATNTVYRLSNIELASRMSFFIWSSIPDDRLLQLAEKKQLNKPDVLKSQVLRMLEDSRSSSLVTNFAAQWLYLRNLKSFRPDMRLFPDFDDNLRSALKRETELLFESVLREDRSVLKLIRSDQTFLNERLAKHYGIRGVFGSEFRPVKLAKESHRGGLLRHGSILAVTSYATRTSPTIRGNWILENILGTPPPPPPPNVPGLKDKTVSASVSIRERLAEHRANPACASCHDLMDPVGFSLENFDSVGRWRWFDQEQPIDASGALPDGTKITSLDQLEAGILKRPEMFVGTLAEKLLTFALGRGVELQDAAAIRKIVRQAAEDDYKFSSLILGIASSPPFQMRVAE